MDKFGLIGHPLKGSLSPKLFDLAYGGKFVYDLIEGEDFETSYGRFLSEYKAINITAPFKEKAFAQAVALAKDGLGEVSGPCWKTGATNLMVKTPGGIQAHNTDFSGVILSVAEALFPGLVAQCYHEYGERGHIKVHQFIRQELPSLFPMRPQALVVGCGGAGKAAAVAAAEMGFATVLMNRTESKAREIEASLPEYSFIVDPVTDFKDAVGECDLVIYTLPVALPEAVSLDPDGWTGRKIILEANYKTPCLARLDRQNGVTYVSGYKWLLYQAIAGYGTMTGVTPDFGAMLGGFEK